VSDDPNIVVENELLRRGFTSIPNYIFGLPISSNAKLIYMALLSYAWTNNSCYPGLAKLCTDVSLSDKPVTKAIEELSNATLLEVKRRGQGKTNLYIIKDFKFTPVGQNGHKSRIGVSPIKESDKRRFKNRTVSDSKNGGSPALKSEKRRIPSNRIEKNTEEETTEETHPHKSEHANGGVSVGSKFTLEECRRYAAHLHATGQGITNPGGYATTIYRSGEADPLIESFLHPPTPDTVSVEASECPDCRGTGFWYPQGIERGVSKCKHERLQNQSQKSEGELSSHKLEPDEIAEHATMIAELLDSGYTLDQAKAQFSSGFSLGDWQAICEMATARTNGSDNSSQGTSV
jgi:hypothetical protein